MRKLILILSLVLSSTLLFADNITFSGGSSSVVLRDGRENVVLSEGASVAVGSMEIQADTITLSGDDWRYVTCTGNASVIDPERGISIRTASIWYDRSEERILISSWFEVDDTENEVTATGASLEYLMNDERLQLDKDVSLLKNTEDSGIMRCSAESVIFARTSNTLELRGSATVDWDGDRYEAEVISVDLDTDSISLDVVDHLSKFYGRKHVVKNVSFSMQSGDITGLLGPNGAGKTTSFYMIVGFIKADGGEVMIDGANITKLPMHKRSRLGLAYLPQEASIFRKLSVDDNINLVLQTQQHMTKAERSELHEKLISDFGLEKVRKQYGYTLSGGERRRTEIARSLATSPKFLLLDEPFAGIDPKAVYEIKQIIKRLAASGIGILITDHNVRDTLEITTTAHIISDGEILVSGTKEELLHNEEAREIYFGKDFEKEST